MAIKGLKIGRRRDNKRVKSRQEDSGNERVKIVQNLLPVLHCRLYILANHIYSQLIIIYTHIALLVVILNDSTILYNYNKYVKKYKQLELLHHNNREI